MIIKEVAVENFTQIPEAIANGATRIELNDNLAVGGTTVSHGVLEEAAKYLDEKQIPLVAMIRPRAGNFVYNDVELKIMEHDLFTAQQLGVDAVTFGALTPGGELDEEAMELLIGAAGGMQVVFHIAFDMIKPELQQESLAWLIDHGVSRVLTHGGALDQPIDKTVPHLQEIIAWAGSDIEILPGGGINYQNYQQILEQLPVKQLHGTKLVPLSNVKTDWK